jgi:proteic killer suppression protein
MIVSFQNQATKDIFNGENTAAARRILPTQLFRVAGQKLSMIERAGALDELRRPPGNRLEMLVGDRAGQHSIRINQKFRVCFVWTKQGAENVEITDYH